MKRVFFYNPIRSIVKKSKYRKNIFHFYVVQHKFYVYLYCVFHGIRFKVNERLVVVTTINFFCTYSIIIPDKKNRPLHIRTLISTE